MTNAFTQARPNIFLTSMFRSGSTHVKVTLMRCLPTYHAATTVLSAGAIGDDNHCAIDIFAAQILLPSPETIFHQHTAGTSGNVALLKNHGIRPVVMMRNMLDSMLSVVELLNTGEPQRLGIYYPSKFHNWDMDDQLWWAVCNLPNWYFTFYLSWKYADIDKHIIWYDEYYKDQVAGVRGILDHVGFKGNIEDEYIHDAAHTIQGDSRFKFGLPGRGKKVFKPDYIRNIRDQAAAWPEWKELTEELIER